MKAKEVNIGALTEMSSGQPEAHPDSLSFMDRLINEVNEGANFGGKIGVPIGGVLGVAAAIYTIFKSATNPDPGLHLGVDGSIFAGIVFPGGGAVAGGIAGAVVGGAAAGLSQIAKEVGLTKKNLFTDNKKYMHKKVVSERATHISDIRSARENLQTAGQNLKNTINKTNP